MKAEREGAKIARKKDLMAYKNYIKEMVDGIDDIQIIYRIYHHVLVKYRINLRERIAKGKEKDE